jgi:hypothetical protein
MEISKISEEFLISEMNYPAKHSDYLSIPPVVESLHTSPDWNADRVPVWFPIAPLELLRYPPRKISVTQAPSNNARQTRPDRKFGNNFSGPNRNADTLKVSGAAVATQFSTSSNSINSP